MKKFLMDWEFYNGDSERDRGYSQMQNERS